MSIFSTPTWKRIGTVATAVAAVGGIVYASIVFASDQVESISTKVVETRGLEIAQEEAEKVQDKTYSQIVPYLLQIDKRLINAEIADLTEGKDSLTVSEQAKLRELQEEKADIKRQLKNVKPD